MRLICVSEGRARPCLLVRPPERHHPHVSPLFAFFLAWPVDFISPFSSCQDFDDRLIKLVWRSRPMGLQSREPSMLSMGAYSNPFDSQAAILSTDPNTIPGTPSAETKEKEEATKPEEPAPKKSFFGWRSARPRTQAGDPEKETEGIRPTKLIAPIYNGLGVALAICAYRPRLYLFLPLTIPKSSWEEACECYSWNSFSMAIMSASRWSPPCPSYSVSLSSVKALVTARYITDSCSVFLHVDCDKLVHGHRPRRSIP